MGVLEQIGQMRSQGMEDEEIVRSLQERGVSPKSINDALNQAQIKKAVSDGEFSPPAPSPGKYLQQAPAIQEVSGDEYMPQQQEAQQYAPQEYYPQQGYEEQYSRGTDTDAVMEISEQVFNDKIQKIQKQVKEVSDFKVLAESKLNSVSERLKRIEDMIDKMEMEILEKVGSYGKGIESTQKEIGMMQDSFSKMVNPIADRSNRRFSSEKPREEIFEDAEPENQIQQPGARMQNNSGFRQKPKKVSR